MALSLLVFFFPQELAFPLLTVWLDRDRHRPAEKVSLVLVREQFVDLPPSLSIALEGSTL